MEFKEFREKFGIDGAKLHKLVLKAHELYVFQQNEMEEYGIDPSDYEYEPGSYEDECLQGFLRLLTEEKE